MPIRKPYYGLHQIVAGQYTPGNEFILADGSDYIGAYHVLPNAQLFTHAIPKINSAELFERRADVPEIVKRYNRITDRRLGKYESPVPYQPIPNPDDYEFGEIQRFFVQKRNNPIATVTEIDVQQFNTTNTQGVPGINGVAWKRLLIPWKISLISASDASDINRRTLIQAEGNFPGIGLYVSNVLEFYK